MKILQNFRLLCFTSLSFSNPQLYPKGSCYLNKNCNYSLDSQLLESLTANRLMCDSAHVVLAVLNGSTHDLSLFARVCNSIGKVGVITINLSSKF